MTAPDHDAVTEALTFFKHLGDLEVPWGMSATKHAMVLVAEITRLRAQPDHAQQTHDPSIYFPEVKVVIAREIRALSPEPKP